MTRKNNTRHWVLIRGLGRSQYHWEGFPDRLRAMCPQDEITLIDLAGNGTENNRKSFLSVENYAKDIDKRLKNTTGPFSVISISLGAMVASAWAEFSPEKIHSLVLINTSGADCGQFWERLRLKNYPSFISMYVRGASAREKERAFLKITAKHIKNPEDVIERSLTYPETTNDNILRQALAGASFRFSKTKPSCPVLIMASTDDDLVNSICSERLSRRWQVPFFMHPEGDHDLPLVDPNWVIEKILGWHKT